ncbi:hypothetical protein K6119_03620 [Paracrocinitomix mangrovi]|uniref:hypothetical protein n=1 Tax=Paracrocinitomix mangrovi TaxID=2862509 RepID=UPI001C8EA886|nr:hypothetical protein [Paracrocinitomix mangrovi]UKN02600.1 hypothetical protein K6119_03620 [Paracrocinitomix mangrovi]
MNHSNFLKRLKRLLSLTALILLSFKSVAQDSLKYDIELYVNARDCSDARGRNIFVGYEESIGADYFDCKPDTIIGKAYGNAEFKRSFFGYKFTPLDTGEIYFEFDYVFDDDTLILRDTFYVHPLPDLDVEIKQIQNSIQFHMNDSNNKSNEQNYQVCAANFTVFKENGEKLGEGFAAAGKLKKSTIEEVFEYQLQKGDYLILNSMYGYKKTYLSAVGKEFEGDEKKFTF